MQAKKPLKKMTKAELLEQVAVLTAALRQERADAINLRQRSIKDQVAARQQSQLLLLGELLPILDNLQRAFALPPQDIANHPWVKGVLGIDQQLTALVATSWGATHQGFRGAV